ncbi:MAG: GNAT family N-acetyltransferase [Actinomycetota bacterium]
MRLEVREAKGSDFGVLRDIGRGVGSNDVDDAYFRFVSTEGRLCMAVDRSSASERIIGYAAAVPVGEVTMISDLFVDRSVHGNGVGGVLARAIIADSDRVMTCSSQHPAATRVYERFGLQHRARLLYLVGSAVGGGSPLLPAPWTGGRGSLVEFLESTGARVCGDIVIRDDDAEVQVLRLDGSRSEEQLQRVLAACPQGRSVRCCAIESTRLAAWAVAHGFVVVDHDLFMATRGVAIDAPDSCVHPGLW